MLIAHVDVIGHQMPLLDPAAFLFGQSVKHPAKLPTHHAKQRSAPILRDEYDVLFALPFSVTQTLVVLHGSCLVVRFGRLTTQLPWRTARKVKL